MTSLSQQACTPCTEATQPLSESEIKELWLETPMWEVHEADGIARIRRVYEFPSYSEAVNFTTHVARIAEAADHHPTITTRYREVEVKWYTHTIKGLHTNDFILAAKSDQAYLEDLDAERGKSVVGEASEESFPASDSPGWIGTTQEESKEDNRGL